MVSCMSYTLNYYMISNIISLCFRFQHGGFRTVTRCYCYCCCCLECEMVSPSFHSQKAKVSSVTLTLSWRAYTFEKQGPSSVCKVP